MFGSRFLDNGSSDSRQVYSFWKLWFKGFISSCATYRTFLLLDPENEAQVGPPSSTHYANGWFRFSLKLLMLAASKFKDHMRQTMKLHTRNGVKHRNYLQFEPLEKYFVCWTKYSFFCNTMVKPEILLIEWQPNDPHWLPESAKIIFTLLFIRDSSVLVKIN